MGATAAGGAEIEAAQAKINLYLHVVRKRADGYHELDSLVVFAGLSDMLRVSADAKLSLVIDGPFAEALKGEPDNLVLKAARALAARIGGAPGARIELTKVLPVAAGIGGGSADAAATLRALRRLWAPALDDRALGEIAAGLGSDVPVCLASRPSYFAGRGELLAAVPDLPKLAAVLVNPRISLPTAQVFAVRQRKYSAPARLAAPPRDARELAQLLAQRGNDLEGAAIRLAPAIDDVLDALAGTGSLLSRMSGSGATCFGLYDEPAAAAAAAAALRTRRPDWWVAETMIVSR